MSGKAGEQDRKRNRQSSSDIETEKPAAKMADRSVSEPAVIGNEEIKNILLELRKEQTSLKNIFTAKIDAMRDEVLGTLEAKMHLWKEEVFTEIGRLDSKMEDLEKRLSIRMTVMEQKQEIENIQHSESDVQPASTARAIRRLEYKALEQEARSRRTNIIIHNIAEEEGEECELVFILFNHLLVHKLGIEKQIQAEKAYRLGSRRRERKNDKNTPIPLLVKLRDLADVNICLANSSQLKGTKIGLSRDYPEKIRRARDSLEKKRRVAVGEGKKATIAFPAKLIVEGTVQEDALPDWSETLKSD